MVVYILKGSSFKGSIIERFNKTLKTRMARYMTEHGTTRWVDALQGITQAYNKSYHRSVKMTPNEASLLKNRDKVFAALYPKRDIKPICSLKVGQKVRTALPKGKFAKGYDIGWTEAIYEIVKVEGVIFHFCM